MTKFKKGEKQLTILLEAQNQGGMSYMEIIKMAYEMSNGRGSFDPIKNRGYWSGAFVGRRKSIGWLGGYGGANRAYYKPAAWCTRCFDLNDKVYTINENGLETINSLLKKFRK